MSLLRIPFVLVLMGAFVSIGCSYSLVTTKPFSDGGTGLVYYLPKQMVRISITRTTTVNDAGGIERTEDEIKPELLPLVPDGALAYVADIHHSRWSNDSLEIKTSASGLLESVDVTSDDETGAVIEAMIDTAARIAVLAATGFPVPPVGQFTGAAPAGAQKKETFEFVFDPALQLPRHVSQGMSELGYALRITPEATRAAARICADSCEGIVYRRPIVRQIEVVPNDGQRAVAAIVAALPNGGPQAIAPVRGGRFTRRQHVLAFDGGMPRSSKAIQPSEVAEAVAILPRSVERIGAIPAEMLQLKIDYSSKEESLAERQKGLVDAQAALLEALRRLEDVADEGDAKESRSDGVGGEPL